MALEIVPISLREANRFIFEHHRHNLEVCPGMQAKYCLAVATDNRVVGVAIVGRPVARLNCDGWTLEVARTCTNGHHNANSILYGACWRIARALGYRRLITYSLPEESGASLKAAGWECMGQAGGGNWSNRKRSRRDAHNLGPKIKWQKTENWKETPRPRVETDPSQMDLFSVDNASALFYNEDAACVIQEEKGKEHDNEPETGG